MDYYKKIKNVRNVVLCDDNADVTLNEMLILIEMCGDINVAFQDVINNELVFTKLGGTNCGNKFMKYLFALDLTIEISEHSDEILKVIYNLIKQDEKSV